MEKNIKDFNNCVAMVLERLYQHFPKPIILSTEELDESSDRETIKTYTATLEFLTQEGFIRYRSATTDGVFMDVVLTAKGLTLLNAVPEALVEKKSFIDAIKSAFKEGSKIGLKTIVETLLKESLKWKG